MEGVFPGALLAGASPRGRKTVRAGPAGFRGKSRHRPTTVAAPCLVGSRGHSQQGYGLDSAREPRQAPGFLARTRQSHGSGIGTGHRRGRSTANRACAKWRPCAGAASPGNRREVFSHRNLACHSARGLRHAFHRSGWRRRGFCHDRGFAASRSAHFFDSHRLSVARRR
jgi:hypothetical protein